MKIISVLMLIGIHGVVIPEVVAPDKNHVEIESTTELIIGTEKLPKYGPASLCVRIFQYGRSRIFQPICGTDGVTYSNPCEFKKANCLTGKKTMKKCDGTCDNCTEYISSSISVPTSPRTKPRTISEPKPEPNSISCVTMSLLLLSINFAFL